LTNTPIWVQEQFAVFWREIRSLRRLILKSTRIGTELRSELQTSGLAGALTREWRHKHLAEILNAQSEGGGSHIEPTQDVSLQATESVPAGKLANFPRPARRWLIGELSNFQTEVWNMMRQEWRGSVIVDDPDMFNDFCTNPHARLSTARSEATAPFNWIRSLPRRPSTSRMHSGTDRVCGAISSTNAAEPGCSRTSCAVVTRRFRSSHATCNSLAVRLIPSFRATSTAADQSSAGIRAFPLRLLRELSVKLRNADRTGSGSTEDTIRGFRQPVSLG
jgi:hypothetical protein